jgi:serine/threonine protein kinase
MVSPPSSENGSDSPKERSPVALPEGTQLRDQYQIGEVLGVGNFGITYQARDEHLDTTVAIKEYYPRQIAGRTDESQVVEPYSTEEEEDFEFGRQRFLGEGRILARFEHDNIVRVRSYFEANGTGYLVMDYYEGQTLDDYLAQNGGSLSESESVDIIQSVLDGLEPVHDEGLLHRDIDPQNIYRRSSGEIVLLDFGAARVAMGERSKSLSLATGQLQK